MHAVLKTSRHCFLFTILCYVKKLQYAVVRCLKEKSTQNSKTQFTKMVLNMLLLAGFIIFFYSH